MIKMILLTNNQILISQIEEVGADIGEPDCKLIKPFLVDISNKTLSPWLSDFSNESIYMINSDKILTLTNPKATLIEKYEELIK